MFSPQFRLSLFLCLSMCLGIGILRFSYTALLPSTREAFAWSSSFASILGSANLLGYLIGAFWAMRLSPTPRMVYYIIFAALFGTVSLMCCGFARMPEAWYFFWRIVSGISGGLMMILSPTIVAQCCELKDRFKINMIGFSGLGLGVLCATLFLPYLDQIAIRSAWLILTSFAFLICLALILLLEPLRYKIQTQTVHTQKSPIQPLYYSIVFIYACSAFAYVPHSLFWIDYLDQVIKLNLFWINIHWVLYGVGSALGAFCAYRLARQWGNFLALKILYVLYIFAILSATFLSIPVFSFISSFATGLLNPAVVFLTSYTILQCYGTQYKYLWGLATLSFAAIQLLGGLSFSALQYFGVPYSQQFYLAAIVLSIGFIQFFYFSYQKTAEHLLE